MKRIEIEQSSKSFSRGHSGLVLVGHWINSSTELCQRMEKEVPRRLAISHANGVKTSVGILFMGNSDFEAAEGWSGDDWFKEALDIQKVPFQEPLRQRFDKHARVFERLAGAASVELLERTQVTVMALSTGDVALDLDVFCLDNSDTKKEGVSRTDRNDEGYAPIAAYLGRKRWCLGMKLRPGSQHSQNGFVGFLRKMLGHGRKLTRRSLLVRTDSAHDVLETLLKTRRHPKVNFVIPWNPHRPDCLSWRDRAFREGRVMEPRPGKKVAILSTWVTRHYGEKSSRFRLVNRVTESILDAKGQMLIQPDITLEGWWPSLSIDKDQGIRWG